MPVKGAGLDYVAVLIAVVNLAVAAYRANQVLGQNRTITFAWALITYWSFFLMLLVIDGPFTNFRGFTGDVVSVTQETIRFAVTYAFIFNLVFLCSEALVWRVLGGARRQVMWSLGRTDNWLKAAVATYAAFLIGGATLYWLKTRGLGYTRGFVDFQGSNWPSVFLWASAPLITIKVLQRQYLAAVICMLPFVFFAVTLYVRAFLLVSLLPAMMIMYFQYIDTRTRKRKQRLRIVLAAVAGLIVLVALSNIVTFGKLNSEALSGLPDAGMVFGMNIVFEGTRESHFYTGWNSLTLYIQNILTPFMKLLHIPRTNVQDTPVYMAYLVDGVPKGNSVFYHYPTLWYSDAFLSFGLAGVALGALWGVILSVWEFVMRRAPIVLALLLPFYIFHTYMLIRGATAGAANPLGYSLYVAVIVMLAVAPLQLFRSTRPAN